MSWFSDLFMSSKEKAERERKKIEAERAEDQKRWLEGKRRFNLLIEEQRRIKSRLQKGIPTTGFDVREEIKREELRKSNIHHQSSTDLINPLNPLSPISPISIWNTDDNHHHNHKHQLEDVRPEDREDIKFDNDHRHEDLHQDNNRNDDYQPSYSEPDSSSYDSGSYDSGSSDSGGGGGD